MTLKKRAVENLVGKGEMHFLLFPQYFLPYENHKSSLEIHINYNSANAFNLE